MDPKYTVRHGSYGLYGGLIVPSKSRHNFRQVKQELNLHHFLLPMHVPIGSLGRTVYFPMPIHEWLIFMVNVGKYTVRPMDPMHVWHIYLLHE